MQQTDGSDLLKAAVIAAAMVAHQRRQDTFSITSHHQGPSASAWKIAGRWEAMGR